jgi:hypothetical protein
MLNGYTTAITLIYSWEVKNDQTMIFIDKTVTQKFQNEFVSNNRFRSKCCSAAHVQRENEKYKLCVPINMHGNGKIVSSVSKKYIIQFGGNVLKYLNGKIVSPAAYNFNLVGGAALNRCMYLLRVDGLRDRGLFQGLFASKIMFVKTIKEKKIAHFRSDQRTVELLTCALERLSQEKISLSLWMRQKIHNYAQSHKYNQIHDYASNA